MAHIAIHHSKPIKIDEPPHLGHAPLIGGQLRLQIGDILIGIARGPWAFAQTLAEIILQKPALVADQAGGDQHAFFADIL
ncbi:hypothetical protein AQ1_01972 [alpha proteobacterium Q-1]|nr:hypothetical protein AQ1_01972 [alpha proteobacterium Q-1]